MIFRRKRYNYRVTVILKNGKRTKASVFRLNDVHNVCRLIEKRDESEFIQAIITPSSRNSKTILPGKIIIMDSQGKYSYYDKGMKVHFIKNIKHDLQ